MLRFYKALAVFLLLCPLSQIARADLCADPVTHAYITCASAPTASTTPFSIGSSLTPSVLNSYTITGTVTANSTTFTCVSGCSSLVVGQGITGSDGVNLIFPSTAGQLGTLITNVGTGINGATITVSIATNPSLTPGTYTLTVGKDRWSTTSTAIANTIGAANIWGGLAAQGNSTWAQAYLSGDCDTGAKVTNCFLMQSGASSQINNFWGARTSDNTASGAVEANVSLAVNDDAVNSKAMWNHYWETIILAGAAPTNQSRALESTIYNYNATSGALKPDPYFFNKNGGTENIRLSVGQSGVGTLYNSMDAISIIGIGGSAYESGILFGASSLDESATTHPPAIALPSGANGYGITWYEATGYTTPSWNLYSTSTANSGNLFALNDTSVTVSIPNDLSTGVVTLGSGYLSLSGNHTGTFNGQGSNLEIATNTINDPTSSGTIPTVSINHIGVPTLTSTSATTLSVASTLGITGCPIASTNVTITVCYALRVFGDIARFDGSLEPRGGITATGATATLNASSNFNVGLNTGSSTGTTTIGGTTAGNATNLASVNTQIGGIKYASSTAPTIASGFNTASFSITAASTAAFQVTVGTSTGTATGVLTMPTASNGWACSVANVTNSATSIVEQSASSTTSVTVTNYVRTTGVAGNFTNSDKLNFVCGAF